MKFFLISILFCLYNLASAQQNNWKYYTTPDSALEVFAPAPFTEKEGEETNYSYNDIKFFVSIDSITNEKFYVFKKTLNPFVHYDSDTSVFTDLNYIHKNNGTTISEIQTCKNGVSELFISFVSNENEKNIHYLKYIILNDAVYFWEILNNSTVSKQKEKFLNEYKVLKNFTSKYKDDKTSLILENINSTDSLTRLNILYAFRYDNVINKSNKNLYLNALLHYSNIDSTQCCNILYDFSRAFKSLKADNELIEFIKTNFDKTNNNLVKGSFLNILSRIKTNESYNAILYILENYKYLNRNSGFYDFELNNALKLTATYLKDPIIKLLLQEDIENSCSVVLNKLIDSGYICLEELLPYKQNIINMANKYLDTCTKGYFGQTNLIIRALLYFNDEESKNLIIKYKAINILPYKRLILEEQLKLYMNPDKELINALAKDTFSCVDVYNLLSEFNQEKCYPREFYKQDVFAYNISYYYAIDSWDFWQEAPAILTLLSKTEKMSNGEKYLFYVYSFVFGNYENNNEKYLLYCAIPQSGNFKEKFIKNTMIEFKYISNWERINIEKEVDSMIIENGRIQNNLK